jgi:hypothetical protein
LVVWLKTKTPRLTGNRGVFEIVQLNQKFIPTMPSWQSTRIQMETYPLVCTEFSMVENVVFIFDAHKKHHRRAFVKVFPNGEKCVVGFWRSARLASAHE